MRHKCISNICTMYLDVPFGCRIAAPSLFLFLVGFSGQKIQTLGVRFRFCPHENMYIYKGEVELRGILRSGGSFSV